MGHSIQVIASHHLVAERVCKEYPQLGMLKTTPQFAIIPVDEEFIDQVVVPRPSQHADNQFSLLTGGFLDLLLSLSQFGPLAYLETEYFGGHGGQGALVCNNQSFVMPPAWSDSNVIDRALELLGVPTPCAGDRFTLFQLDRYRSNDRIVAEISERT